jgi:hypothetical protein
MLGGRPEQWLEILPAAELTKKKVKPGGRHSKWCMAGGPGQSTNWGLFFGELGFGVLEEMSRLHEDGKRRIESSNAKPERGGKGIRSGW